jgi:hypothetical protein
LQAQDAWRQNVTTVQSQFTEAGKSPYEVFKRRVVKDQDTPANGGASQNVKALFRVVERGNLAWTYRLIAMGTDVNVHNETGQSPLMLAAEKGYADMVQILIQNGANPKLANNQGESALTIALMKGYTRIAETLEMAEASHKYAQGEGREPA